MVAHSKVLLAGIISGIVAITTSFLGVTGTVIGAVIASIIYNFLSEFLEEHIEDAKMTRFENELIYVFPLIIILIIHFLLILAFLSEWGYLGHDFLHAYLSLQNLVSNNLYRILGISTLLISIYPRFLKTKNIDKTQSILLAFVGIIFLLKGFIDLNNPIVYLYRDLYLSIDFYLALIALIILTYLIFDLSYNAYKSNVKLDNLNLSDLKLKVANKKHSKNSFNRKNNNLNQDKNSLNKKENVNKNRNDDGVAINTSIDDIEFVSNDLLNDKKRK